MSQERWTAADDYINERLAPSDQALDAALADSAAAGLPAIAVTASQGKFLQLLARSCGARTILEIGTLGGYSTIWLARGLPAGGRLITIEAEPKHAAVARANIARAGLSGMVDLRLGRGLDVLPHIEAEGRGPFDFIFIDADKTAIPEYFQWAIKLGRPGSMIIADNVVRKGAIVEPNHPDPNVQGVRRFYDMLGAETRVDATAIQTVGSKGYDGFAMAVIKGQPSAA